MMGRIQPGMVVTATERRQNPKRIQPGNREWVTVVQAIGASGHVIPPYILFPGKHIQLNWFENRALPPKWKINTTDNGWITSERAMEWLQHFEEHTKNRLVGTWRLLFLDSHESHNTPQFDQFYLEHKIICFYLPPHSSHITQPLDVGCFRPLKRYYGDQISKLTRYGQVVIYKPDFLRAFLAVFPKAFTT
jgi:hypothetical protein